MGTTYHQTVQSDSTSDFEILFPQHSPNDIGHRNDPYNIMIIIIMLRLQREWKRRNDEARGRSHFGGGFLCIIIIRVLSRFVRAPYRRTFLTIFQLIL